MPRWRWKRWPSGSSPRPRISTRASRPSWRSESRSSRASDSRYAQLRITWMSLRNDVLLRKRLDLPRRISEGPQDRFRILAFRWDPCGVPRLRHRVLRGVGDDLKLSNYRHIELRVEAAGFH